MNPSNRVLILKFMIAALPAWIPVAITSGQEAHEQVSRRGTKLPERGDGEVEAGRSSLDPDSTITAIIEEVLDQHELPGGMVAGIVYKDQLRAIGAAGYRKKGSDERMTIHDKVHVGSCTKAMTATMIATLVEDGTLAWDATLAELLNDIEMHSSFQKVTLRQLLSHRAGLPRNAPGTIGIDIAQWLNRDTETDRQRRRDVIAAALNKEPLSPPGSKYAYSNLGYVVAGHLAERAADVSWEQLMRERLFEPLGMKSAGFGPPGRPGSTDQPWGHAELPVVGWTPMQRDNPSLIGPAGTVHCTLADWGRFASVHLGHVPTGKTLLSDQTLELLHEPVSPAEGDQRDYAFGWIVAERDWAKGRTFTHAGSNTMWYAIIWVAPHLNTAFLVAANNGSGFEACDTVIGQLIDYAQRGVLPAD